ncbi:POK9 protein, partial [Mohoua ochrocephala]|nr:POK9 protein [Mohoua ochrocephala]
GSLGVDLETSVDVTLTDSKVALIPTMANGPLHQGDSIIGGLLVGRSSAGKQGLIVLPSVIDADYTGNIKIIAYTLHPPVRIPAGSKIAQIVDLLNSQPLCDRPQPNWQKPRGTGSFGSTGAAMSTQKLSQRPTQLVVMQQDSQQIEFHPLLGTGADVTIVS